ncbi:trypsin-like peptidase domain-containing protein [Micromonospora sp. CPCC 206061]|uniref:trypsin-like peptidase domain-containing protein n=1 Tax=Micromonospora sp. CPCC 206061 TaxID=3122410 RepID=UPI002FF16C82
MSENETNPPRQPVNPDAEPSHPTTELPPAQREQSDSSATEAIPTHTPTAQSAPASLWAAPVSDAPAPAAPEPGGVPSAPAPGNQYAPSPWHPAAHHQPGWPGNAGYTHPTSGAAGQASGPAAAGHGPVPPGYGPAPAHGPQGPLPPGQPPIWAQQPGAHAQPAGPGKAGKAVLLGVVGLVLMAGSGIAGGAVALAVNDGGTTTKTYTAAPVINSADLPKIASQVENSVVSITTNNGEGSGVILSADGYVLTNNHVVASASGDTVTVVFANGKNATAKIIGTDPRTDLAVVKAEGVSDLAAAKFGDSDAMQVGDTVLAIGSPLGLQGSVTAGIISATDRTIQTGGQQEQQPNPFQPQQQTTVSSISGLLQTDAPINPGNSGGALVNTNGEVIGINTAIATAGQSTGNIGVGFAIPSNRAKDVADALKNGKKVSHPSLGVSVGTAENGGALVNLVNPNTPAAQAGLQQGDVITKFGDKSISDSDDLVAAVQAGKVGDRVTITYTRNGEVKTATVTLAEAS